MTVLPAAHHRRSGLLLAFVVPSKALDSRNWRVEMKLAAAIYHASERFPKSLTPRLPVAIYHVSERFQYL